MTDKVVISGKETHAQLDVNTQGGPVHLDVQGEDSEVYINGDNVDFVAPVGPAGPQGIQGVQGIKGDKGAIGATGPQGLQGTQGIQGVAGVAGPAGADGLTGPSGADGATGPQGPQGADGAAGAAGAVGPQGPAGVDGAVGPQGPQGPIGLDGPQGPAGVDGDDGIVPQDELNAILSALVKNYTGSQAGDNGLISFLKMFEDQSSPQLDFLLANHISEFVSNLPATPAEAAVKLDDLVSFIGGAYDHVGAEVFLGAAADETDTIGYGLAGKAYEDLDQSMKDSIQNTPMYAFIRKLAGAAEPNLGVRKLIAEDALKAVAGGTGGLGPISLLLSLFNADRTNVEFEGDLTDLIVQGAETKADVDSALSKWTVGLTSILTDLDTYATNLDNQIGVSGVAGPVGAPPHTGTTVGYFWRIFDKLIVQINALEARLTAEEAANAALDVRVTALENA